MLWYPLETSHRGTSIGYHNICFCGKISALIGRKKKFYLKLWYFFFFFFFFHGNRDIEKKKKNFFFFFFFFENRASHFQVAIFF